MIASGHENPGIRRVVEQVLESSESKSGP
jgi:hypothetical protein